MWLFTPLPFDVALHWNEIWTLGLTWYITQLLLYVCNASLFSKFKKPQEKYSAETETKKRANENQTPFFETGRNKKFKQMSEAGDSFIPLQRNKGVNEQRFVLLWFYSVSVVISHLRWLFRLFPWRTTIYSKMLNKFDIVHDLPCNFNIYFFMWT